jgi:hypothetical protein
VKLVHVLSEPILTSWPRIALGIADSSNGVQNAPGYRGVNGYPGLVFHGVAQDDRWEAGIVRIARDERVVCFERDLRWESLALEIDPREGILPPEGATVHMWKALPARVRRLVRGEYVRGRDGAAQHPAYGLPASSLRINERKREGKKTSDIRTVED